MKPLHAVAMVLFLGRALGAAEPAFEKKPVAVKAGDAVRIDFTSHCVCEGSGFDVDPFGRVFLSVGVRGRHGEPPRRAREAGLHGGGNLPCAVSGTPTEVF
jgi:hypothetical protein